MAEGELKMDIGSIVIVIENGQALEITHIHEDGTRVFKKLTDETKVNPDTAFYCYRSMLKESKIARPR